MRPKLELLWWRGCPSWPRAVEQLREAAKDAGLDPEAIDVREVRSEGDAAREGFVGSPTILIDGEDPFPPGGEEPAGLTCRVYLLGDGRVSPLPDPEQLREAVTRAVAARANGSERSEE